MGFMKGCADRFAHAKSFILDVVNVKEKLLIVISRWSLAIPHNTEWPCELVHVAAMSHPLDIMQYKIEGHPRCTEHWSLAVPLSRNDAHAFQLKGNYDTFLYDYDYDTKFSELASAARGGILIGVIPSGKLSWLKEKLKEVQVSHHNPEFDCQNWVLEAIQLLKETEGIINSGITEKKVRQELEEEEGRWEVADDTIIERLYSS